MTKIHKHFEEACSLSRERREVYDHLGAEHPAFGQSPAEQAEFRRLQEHVRHALEEAIKQNPEFARFGTDEEIKRIALSLLQYEGHAGVQYFPEGVQKPPEDPAWEKKREELMVELTKKSGEAVRSYIASVASAREKMKSAQEKYEPPPDLPPEVETAAGILDGIKGDQQNRLVERQIAVQQLAGDVERAVTKEDVTAAIDKFFKNPDQTHGFYPAITDETVRGGKLNDLKSALEKAVTDAKDIEDARKGVLRKLGEAAQLPPERTERTKLDTASLELQKKLAEVNEQKRRQIFGRFPERAKYLYRLAGANGERLVHASVRSDYALDFETMSVRLQTTLLDPVNPDVALKAKMTAEKLQEVTALNHEQFDETKMGTFASTHNLHIEKAKSMAVDILKTGRFTVTLGKVLEGVNAGLTKPQLQGMIDEFFGPDVFTDAANLAEKSDDVGSIIESLKKNYANRAISKEVAAELFGFWKVPEKLKDYLKNELGYNNPVGFSVPALLDRIRAKTTKTSRFGLSVPDYEKLERAGLTDFSARHIFTYASLGLTPGQKIDEGVVKTLTEKFVVFGPEKEVIVPGANPADDKKIKVKEFKGEEWKKIAAVLYQRAPGDPPSGLSDDQKRLWIENDQQKAWNEAAQKADAQLQSIKTAGTAGNWLRLSTLPTHEVNPAGGRGAALAFDFLVSSSDNENALRKAMASIEVGTVMSLFSSVKITPESEELLKQNIEITVRELWDLAGTATGSWWDYFTSLDRNIRDKDGLDEQYRVLDGKSQGLQGMISALDEVEKSFRSADSGMLTAFEQMGNMEKESRKERDALTKTIAVPKIKEHVKAMGYVLRRLDQIQKTIGPSLQSQPSPLIRRNAYFIAWNKSPEDALDYLRDPEGYLKGKDDLQRQLASHNAKYRRTEIEEGQDILSGLRNSMGIGVREKALFILKQNKRLENPQDNFLNWHNDPKRAAPSLNDILYDIEGGGAPVFYLDPATKQPISRVGVMISILSTHTDQTVMVPASDGTDKPVTLKYNDMMQYLQQIQQHLTRQVGDDTLSREQLSREERFNDPLDMVRSGKDALMDMLHSRDRVQQGLACVVIFMGGYVLWQTWKKGGWGKSLIIGLPLFFGLDIVLQKMTGKGAMERLGLTWMNEKDRKSSVEQFLREQKNEKEFKEVDSPAGFEAMKALQDVPVKDLLAWRDTYYSQSSNRKWSSGAPRSLSGKVDNVVDKLGDLSVRNASNEKELGYEMLFKTFESLCLDVAKHDVDSARTVQAGAETIKRRYVDFSEPYLRSLAPEMRNIAASRPGGGFSMLDVLVYERPTPAMMDYLLKNDSFLEWTCRKMGRSLEWIKEQLIKTGSLSAVFMEHMKERLPEDWQWAKGKVLSTGADVLACLRAAKDKTKVEFAEDLAAGWDLVSGLAYDAKISLQANGPGMVTWVVDKSLATVKGGKEMAYAVYLKLLKNGVAGSILEGLAKEIKDATGWDILEKWGTEEYLKEIADYDEQIKKEFMEQLKAFVDTLPSDTQILTWLKEGGLGDGTDVEKIKAVASSNPREALVHYDLLKRKIFSYLAAKRIQYIWTRCNDEDFTSIDLPLKIGAWPNDLGAEAEIKDTYIYIFNNYQPEVVLSLIGNESTMVGTMKMLVEEAQSHPELKLTGASFCKFLLYPGILQAVTRDNAGEFLTHEVAAYLGDFQKEAKQKLDSKEITKEQYENYMAYLDALVTNVIMETILSDRSRRVDLKLRKNQAKELRKQLMMRRGKTPTMVDVLKLRNTTGSELLKSFKGDETVMISGVLQNVRNHPRGRWILMGETPAKERPVEEESTGTAGATKPDKPITPEEVQNLPSTAEAANRPRLLEALQKSGLASEDEVKIRNLFKASTKPAVDDLSKLSQDHVQYFLGVPKEDAQAYAADIIKALTKDIGTDSSKLMRSAEKLEKTFAKNRKKYEKLSDRMQRLLDDGVAKLYELAVQQISAEDKVELMKMRNPKAPKYTDWERTLMSLWRISSFTTESYTSFTDAVSLALEYMRYGGEGGHYSEYLQFLDAQTPKLPHPESATMPWNKSYMQSRLEKNMSAITNTYIANAGGSAKSGLESDLNKRPWK